MISIHLSELAKRGKRREKVPVKRRTGTFMEYRATGKKDDVTSYNNMPSQIVFRPELVEAMDRKAEKSQSIGYEISSGLESQDGKMVMGNDKVGDESSCSIEAGARGMWHSHPGDKDHNIDTFSLLDVVVAVRYRMPIMMAQTCRNGRVWCAVSSAETQDIKNKRVKLNKWEALGYQEDQFTSGGKSKAKDYRNLVKQFCDEFQVKLYEGSKGNLKEYKGDW